MTNDPGNAQPPADGWLFPHDDDVPSTMQFQITEIQFDCSLDDDNWTLKDKLETEEKLACTYTGQIWETDDEDDLIEEITTASGWCIEYIEYRHILA